MDVVLRGRRFIHGDVFHFRSTKYDVCIRVRNWSNELVGWPVEIVKGLSVAVEHENSPPLLGAHRVHYKHVSPGNGA